MARLSVFAAAILFVLLSLPCPGHSAGTAELDPLSHVPGEVILKFKVGTTRADEAACLAELGATAIRRFGSIHALQVRFSSLSVKSAVAHLDKHPVLEYIEPNYIIHLDGVPNDPDFSLQWGLQNAGQSDGIPGADISAPEAWDLATSDKVIVVAVIDSGVDYSHPDLAANIYVNLGEIPANGLDDDSNGYIDDVYGWNFCVGNNEVMDLHGHGTSIAGIIGAVGDNGIGVAGVSWNVKIMPVKWSAYHTGNLGDAIAAVEYAALMNVDIMNLSWGFDAVEPPQALVDACSFANDQGILLVCAAGNYSHDLDVRPHFPGCLQLPLIINVAASNQQDFKPHFSNYGRSQVDLAAPGCGIHSTLPQGQYGLFGEGGPYIPGTGTSFAAPFVSGALALIKARHPALSPTQVKARLLDSVDVISALTGVVRTGGRLNLHLALLETDTIPPGPVRDFQVQEISHDWAILTWTAAGDDGDEGRAADYLVRCTTSPIDEYDFDAFPAPNGQYLIGPPDGTYSLRIDHLLCETQYYFAIKAVDEANNHSVAQVVLATTNGCPPRAEISVTALQASIIGSGSVTHEFTLANTGTGQLQFNIHTSAVEWLSVEPPNGWLPGGTRRVMTVLCDANNLCSGDYTAALSVACNDPEQPQLGLPVLLQVTGTPRIVLSASALIFPATDIGGSATTNLTLNNAGCEPLLVTSLPCDRVEFTATPTRFELAAGDSQVVRITFSPSAWEPLNSVLVFHSNDPQAATVAVELHGEAPPPSPTELNLCNVPNPFNPYTEFRFNLSYTSEVQLRIYNLKGEVVRLLQGGTQPPGPRVLDWDGRDDSGYPVSSGAYVYRLYLGEYPAGEPRKMLLVR